MANEVRVRVTGNTKELGVLGQQADNVGKKFKAMAAVAGVALVAGLVQGTRQAIDAASNLNESINAVGVVFGESQGKIIEWGKTAAEQAGLSRNAFHEAVIPIGALLKNFGFDTDESSTAVIELTKRAADLGSTLNIDTSVALDKFRAGLAGEAEPLKAFGVDVSVAAIKAEALSLGLYNGVGALTANARAQAAMSIIMRQTNFAAGDFANTLGESLPNQAKKLAAQVENLKARLGENLLPAALDITKAFGEMTEEGGFLEDVLTGLATAGGKAGEGLGDFATAANRLNTIMGEAAPGFDMWGEFWNLVGFNIPEGLQQLGAGLEWLTRGLEDDADAINEAAAAAEYMADANKDDLIPSVEDLTGATEDLTGATEDLLTAEEELANFRLEAINVEIAKIRANQRAEEALRNLIEVQNDTTASADELRLAELEYAAAAEEARIKTELFEESLDGLDGRRIDVTIAQNWISTGMNEIASHTSTRPQNFHRGGTVPGPRGSDVPIIAQGGEQIIPLSASGGGGGITIVVEGSVISERDLVSLIRKELIKIQNRNGSTGIA